MKKYGRWMLLYIFSKCMEDLFGNHDEHVVCFACIELFHEWFKHENGYHAS